MSSAASDSRSALTTARDARVHAAVAELVPAAAAVPEFLGRAAPPRRRRFARRGGFGTTTTSGHGGAVARPRLVAVAAAALLVAVGAAFALRPRTTEQSAVGTVPPRVGRTTPNDTASRESSFAAETGAVPAETEAAPAETSPVAAETAAALAAGAGPNDRPAATPGSSPVATAKPSADQVVPTPAAPESAAGRATTLPAQPSPARASINANANAAEQADDAEAASPAPPRPARAKAPAPASAAATAAKTAGTDTSLAVIDLGIFDNSASVLDSFGARASAPTGSAPLQLGQPEASAAGSVSNPASPATASPAVAAPFTERALCPSVKGSPRLAAHIGDRAVLVVRTADANVPADVVLDALSCTELDRRPVPSNTTPVGG